MWKCWRVNPNYRKKGFIIASLPYWATFCVVFFLTKAPPFGVQAHTQMFINLHNLMNGGCPPKGKIYLANQNPHDGHPGDFPWFCGSSPWPNTHQTSDQETRPPMVSGCAASKHCSMDLNFTFQLHNFMTNTRCIFFWNTCRKNMHKHEL